MPLRVRNTWAEAWTALWAWDRFEAAWAMFTSVISPSMLVRVVWRSVWVVMAVDTWLWISPPWAAVWVVASDTVLIWVIMPCRNVCCAAVRGPPKLPAALCWKASMPWKAVISEVPRSDARKPDWMVVLSSMRVTGVVPPFWKNELTLG